MSDNRRSFTRVHTHVGAEISAGSITCTGAIEDLSLSGVSLRSEAQLAHGTPCKVTLVLTGADPALRIELAGKVSRSEAGLVSVAFEETDSDSYAHLRSLILANAESADSIEDEFEGSVGFKRRDADF
ncbi:MAG: PilZ domain-containing protein [Candidatus Hydrogenedentes bacterium]|nr:PilZ domain-containing protein [Candidatus Hydrogenedentota bacterium]